MPEVRVTAAVVTVEGLRTDFDRDENHPFLRARADSQSDIEGSWIVRGKPSEAVTILQGIRHKLGAGVRVEYAKGPDFKRDIPSPFDAFMNRPQSPPQTREQIEEALNQSVEAARCSDVGVMFLGQLAHMSGEEASHSSLNLPAKQEQLLEPAGEEVGTGSGRLRPLGGRGLHRDDALDIQSQSLSSRIDLHQFPGRANNRGDRHPHG
ncbi:MAG TPA: glycoside hydrolase family 3 C-terminal domain-containing protein [Terriglobia bacterium]|nr:glycoside hydrolase family 3 C-terminal domain-containing protein [Terriglobia bacterium]